MLPKISIAHSLIDPGHSFIKETKCLFVWNTSLRNYYQCRPHCSAIFTQSQCYKAVKMIKKWSSYGARASPASNAPPYHDKLFPQSGADHKSSVILFSTRVQSQDFFRMVTSHIWHRYIFWGCCVWLEAFLARFRHVSSVSHYVSTLTISQDYFLLYVWAPLQGPGYI